jgi:hypothetical protein
MSQITAEKNKPVILSGGEGPAAQARLTAAGPSLPLRMILRISFVSSCVMAKNSSERGDLHFGTYRSRIPEHCPTTDDAKGIAWTPPHCSIRHH